MGCLILTNVPLKWGMVDHGENYGFMAAKSVWEMCKPSVQFSYELKTALKNKVSWKNFHHGQSQVTNMKLLNVEFRDTILAQA